MRLRALRRLAEVEVPVTELGDALAALFRVEAGLMRYRGAMHRAAEQEA